MLKLYKEFKRRKMFRPLVAYAAFAFVLIQICSIVFPALLLPSWTNTFIVVLVILGFPITVFFAWVYDITPGGIQRTPFSSKSTEAGKKSLGILLPITGLLTIIGGAFWIWYSMGDLTTGSELDLKMGIKKSIGVFNFDNLTGEKEGNYSCSAISVYISSVLTNVGKLDVKSRRAILNNNPKDMELDYYIEGSLSGGSGNKNINVSLVNAKSETNLWTGRYEFNKEDVIAYQDTIIHNVLKQLNIDSPVNELISNRPAYKNAETFQLIGEGIYHFEQKKYIASIGVFDTILESDPENIVALYYKANSYYELNNFTDAMEIYKRILGRSDDIEYIEWHWPLSDKGEDKQTLCSNMQYIEEKKLAIMLLRGDGGNQLIGFNPSKQEISWKNPISDKLVGNPTIINNTIFLTSNRVRKEQLGDPSLFAFNIITGEEIFVKEYPRDNDNQAVLFNIVEGYNNTSNDNSTILLLFKKLGTGGEKYRELSLIDAETGLILWTFKVDLDWGLSPKVMRINNDNSDILMLIVEDDLIALNNKNGSELWRKNFSLSKLNFWNNKIFITNIEKKYVSVWDPISRNEVWKYSHDYEQTFPDRLFPGYKKAESRIGTAGHKGLSAVPRIKGEWRYGMDDFGIIKNNDVIVLNFTDGNLIAINFNGGFLNWNRERWKQYVGIAEKIWFNEIAYNRMFCLTKNDTLLTLNMDNGKIINRIEVDRRDYRVHYDESQNAMVLNNSEYLIGVDPKNGEQLWKIKDNNVDKLSLIGNSVLAVKPAIEDSSTIIINNYNRDNGNLIWGKSIDISRSLSTLPIIAPLCRPAPHCDYCSGFTTNLTKYSDDSFLLLLHDEIIKIGSTQEKREAIQKNDVQLQIARTFEADNQFEHAINEYRVLIKQDQMNHDAYSGLANIYQKKNQTNKAVRSLINYYDLILPTSHEGIQTIQKLKNLSVLKWEENVYWDSFYNAEMKTDNSRIFLFLDNNIAAYRINSGAEIWKRSIENKNNKIVHVDVLNNNHIFLIQKFVPDPGKFYYKDYITGKTMDLSAIKRASKYYLTAMDKKDGKISLDIQLNITGERDVVWMGMHNNKIFIQSIMKNKMFITTYDLMKNVWIWEISRDIPRHYTAYDLKPAFYNGNLLLPFDNNIEYIHIESGDIEMKYYDEEIDHIFSFNANSVQSNTMNFIVEDIEFEYVVVNLKENKKISGGSLDLVDPKMGSWINSVFVDVSSSGAITAYQSSSEEDNDPNIEWHKIFNFPLELVGANEENIYLLNMNNNHILVVDTKLGNIIKSVPLLWEVEKIEINNNYIIVQSAKKLYVVPI